MASPSEYNSDSQHCPSRRRHHLQQSRAEPQWRHDLATTILLLLTCTCVLRACTPSVAALALPLSPRHSRSTLASTLGSHEPLEISPSRPKRRKYHRKLPLQPSEKAAALSRQRRQAAYEKMRSSSLSITNEPPSVWSFDALFAAPVLDEKSIREDLYGNKRREEEIHRRRRARHSWVPKEGDDNQVWPMYNATGVDGDKDCQKNVPTYISCDSIGNDNSIMVQTEQFNDTNLAYSSPTLPKEKANSPDLAMVEVSDPRTFPSSSTLVSKVEPSIDKALTRMVEDRLYGYVRSPTGSIQYSNSLLDSSRAVQFRDGVRLGKALTINIDRLVYFAKKDLSHGRLEEAQEYYQQALEMEPTDGRPYLGLSRIAERRGDFEYAKMILKQGISRSSGGFVTVRGSVGENTTTDLTLRTSNVMGKKETTVIGTIPDNGPNPYLLQALGTLEQKAGNLALAENLYLQALRSRPSHAAAWVALAQLRTKELRQGASVGRVCYQNAVNELRRVGDKPSAYVYTAWASMEYKKGKEDNANGIRRARELYELALEADPHCSVAYLQMGVMESECGNFDSAKECFEKVLKFDQRNSRVLQAYAIMESRRSRDDVDSRRVLDLFERALKANPRDAGVFQAYALYVVQLGDVDSARNLLRRGTEVDKRHAPVWQAWGVLETKHSTAKTARDVFQQGIWACAQSGGGQSGGRRCARLWQAWGLLEAKEKDYAAARRCFSRALDADKRNVAAVTAWTSMEASLGNIADARSIFERTLRLFPSPSDEKMTIWRAWEIMEERAGNSRAAQNIFQRSMRDAMLSREGNFNTEDPTGTLDVVSTTQFDSSAKPRKKEIEVSRWIIGNNELNSDVWMNNGSIEGKVPVKAMKRFRGDSHSTNRT